MSFDLPRLHVSTDGFDPMVGAACPEVGAELAQRLAALDRGTVPAGTVDRCLPLEPEAVSWPPGLWPEAAGSTPPRAWAVGQRRGDDTMWRIVTAAQAERMGGHPGWLWTAEAWFDPALGRDARARAPTPTPLRQLVRLMAPLGGRNRRTVKTLSAVLGALRSAQAGGSGHRGPVGVVVERDLLSSASHPARWFVLGLLAILPPGRRESLRVSIGESNPDPSAYDLVLAPGAVDGFSVIDAANPPDDGDDLVAYYVRNRLNDDDPEALEAASYLFDGEGDRWGDGIAALIRDGLPGVSEVTEEMIDQDPDRAVAALAARLRAGAPIDGTVQDQLVRVTLKTHDQRPWRALARRPPLQRADAVDALLAHASSLRPTGELVTSLVELYPRGAPTDVWVPTLMRWLRDGVDPEAVSEAVLTTLSEWPREAGAADVVLEVVRKLVSIGRTERAAAALSSPIAQRLVREGAGASLAAIWSEVGDVAPEHLSGFLQAYIGKSAGSNPADVTGSPIPVDAEERVVEIFGRVKDRKGLAIALLRTWLARGGTPKADDPLFLAVRDSPYLGDWAEALVDQGGDEPGSGGSDAAWQKVAGAVVNASEDPRMGLLSLAQIPSGAASGAVHAEAMPLLDRALGEARFPDPVLSEAAEMLARIAGAPPIWGWVAVTASNPDAFDDATIDATVVEFCAARLDSPMVDLARTAMECLGRAEEWESLDHARWIVRLALGPPGIANVPLMNGLLQGIRTRSDAVPFMAGLLGALLDLPPDHEASLMLLEQLPESGWQGPPLLQVVDRVGRGNIPLSLRRTLVAIAENQAG